MLCIYPFISYRRYTVANYKSRDHRIHTALKVMDASRFPLAARFGVTELTALRGLAEELQPLLGQQNSSQSDRETQSPANSSSSAAPSQLFPHTPRLAIPNPESQGYQRINAEEEMESNSNNSFESVHPPRPSNSVQILPLQILLLIISYKLYKLLYDKILQLHLLPTMIYNWFLTKISYRKLFSKIVHLVSLVDETGLKMSKSYLQIILRVLFGKKQILCYLAMNRHLIHNLSTRFSHFHALSNFR